MKEEIKMTMKWGGFIGNGHLYQFLSKERTFINHLLNLGTTRRDGFWNSFQSSNKGGRRTGAAKRKGGVWWNFSNKDFRENLRRAGQKKKVDKVVITTSGVYPNDVRRSNIMEELTGGRGARRRIA